MARRNLYLSKSKLVSAWQCPKRLHLEKHHPELGETSSSTEALFAVGNQVGEIAQQLYGTHESIEVPYTRRLSVAIRQTIELIEGGARFPIFEATLQHDGVLVRVDVLLPDGDDWRVIEVKASTSVKDVHIVDCAIQYWVLRNVGLKLQSIALAHINNQFVYRGDGDYAGLIVEVDVTERVLELVDSVPELVAKARVAISGAVPDVPVGAHCSSPYDCQFQAHCWPMDTEYPLSGLRGSKDTLGEWVAAGRRDIRDVDGDCISSANQQRIHRVTCAGQPEVLDGARKAIEALAYPRYYLDFETIGPAVPIWAGTRPYASVPIQWSCHIDAGPIDDSPEDLRHEEFLDLSGEPPMRALAMKMIDCLGTSGPILMYTNYEKQVIVGLTTLFPDLTEPLQKIIDRLVDLHTIVKNHYYHPKMLGSWSLKAVSPAVAPHMDYSNLAGINEGVAASEGYLEAIHPETIPERKAELEEQLLRYCRFDTEAMVEIVRFFRDHDPGLPLANIPGRP